MSSPANSSGSGCDETPFLYFTQAKYSAAKCRSQVIGSFSAKAQTPGLCPLFVGEAQMGSGH